MDAKMNIESSATVDKLYGDAIKSANPEEASLLQARLPLFILYRNLNYRENPAMDSDEYLVKMYARRKEIESMTVREMLKDAISTDIQQAEKDIVGIDKFTELPLIKLENINITEVDMSDDLPTFAGIATVVNNNSEAGYNLLLNSLKLVLVLDEVEQAEKIDLDGTRLFPTLDNSGCKIDLTFKHKFVNTKALSELIHGSDGSEVNERVRFRLESPFSLITDHGNIAISKSSRAKLVNDIVAYKKQLTVLQ